MVRIRETNNLCYAVTNFQCAIQMIDEMKKSDDEAMSDFGRMSLAVVHMREGVKLLREFLEGNRYNYDFPKAFREAIRIKNGEIGGFIDWFDEDLTADYAKDITHEQVGLASGGSYSANRELFFDIIPVLSEYVAKLSGFIARMKSLE